MCILIFHTVCSQAEDPLSCNFSMMFKFLSVPHLTLTSFLRYQSILQNLILLVSTFDWACMYWMDRQGNYKGWDHDGETRRGRALQVFAVQLYTFFFFHENHKYFLHLSP